MIYKTSIGEWYTKRENVIPSLMKMRFKNVPRQRIKLQTQ